MVIVMTDYEMKITAATVMDDIMTSEEQLRGKVIIIGNSATLDMNASSIVNGLVVGLNGTTLANEAGTIKFSAPNIMKFQDYPSPTIDSRIIWATDGSHQVNRGAGLKIQNLALTDANANATKGAGVFETGVTGLGDATLVLYYDMQTMTAASEMQDLASVYGGGATANNGVMNASGTEDVTGKFNRARSFDGVDDRITTADQAELDVNNMTLAAWIKPDVVTGVRTIIAKDTAYFLRTNGTTIEFGIWDNVGPTLITYASGAGQVSAGELMHIAATYNGASISIYKNGTLIVGPTVRTSTTNNSAAILEIGSKANTEFFDGMIDEVGIFNAAVSLNNVPRKLAADGKIGQGWYFEGAANAEIEVDTFSRAYSKVAGCLWIKPRLIGTVIRPLLTHGSTGWDFYINASSKLEFKLNSTWYTRTAASTTTIVIDVWQHVGFTYDGETVRFYLNGVADGQTTFPTIAYNTTAKIPISSPVIAIGNTGGGAGVVTDFIGYMDEIYFFNDSDINIAAYNGLTSSAPPNSFGYGLLFTESGVSSEQSTWTSSMSIESGLHWGFDSTAVMPREYWPLTIQGTGFSGSASTGSPTGGQNYLLRNHAPGFTLQTTTTGLKEEYSFRFSSMNPLMVDDDGGDKPINTTIQRRGNVSRVKKIGYSPRKVMFKARINLTSAGGITQLRRLQELASTLYKEAHIFNIYTDKHILAGYQLTDYDESPVRKAPWKLIDVEIEFTKRVL